MSQKESWLRIGRKKGERNVKTLKSQKKDMVDSDMTERGSEEREGGGREEEREMILRSKANVNRSRMNLKEEHIDWVKTH